MFVNSKNAIYGVFYILLNTIYSLCYNRLMVRNPYNKMLTSTKINIFTIVFTIVLIAFGFILMRNDGFGPEYVLYTDENTGVVSQGYTEKTSIYTITFIYALVSIIVGIAVICIRHDMLGVISGILILAFIFFLLTVGITRTVDPNSTKPVYNEERFTLTTMVVNQLNIGEK